MDCTNVLSFSPVPKRFHTVTRSLEILLAPSSQGRNHLVEWQRTYSIFALNSTRRLWRFELHFDKRFSHKFFIPLLTPHFALIIHLLTYKGTCTEIPFCQLSAPDHVTIKDAALQLNTASKSQGKESWEKHLFLSSMRDHTEGEGVETERVRQRERKRELLCALCTGIVCDEEMNHCYLGIGFLQLIVWRLGGGQTVKTCLFCSGGFRKMSAAKSHLLSPTRPGVPEINRDNRDKHLTSVALLTRHQILKSKGF